MKSDDSLKIKVGDYIEGYELNSIITGPTESYHRMRIIVSSIFKDEYGKLAYFGQADDKYKGARGGTIYSRLGEVRKIKGERPFKNKWWETQDKDKPQYNAREVHVGEHYLHFKGNIYIVEALAKSTDTKQMLVIYKNIKTGDMWARTLTEFISPVDKLKYPNIKQYWRFEKVEEDR